MKTVGIHSLLARWLVVAALLSGSAGLFSAIAAPEDSKVDKLRAEARELKAKAQELKEKGASGEAEKVDRESKNLWQKAEQLEQERTHLKPHDQEHAKAIHREMEHLRAKLEDLRVAGKEEEAANVKEHLVALEREAERALPKPDRDNIKDRLRKIKGEIAELHQAGRHEEAERLERKARDLMDKAGGPQPEFRPGPAEGPRPPGEPDEPERRLQHLQAAIGNLHAAGMHEPAEQLAREAEKMRQHLQRPDRPFPPQGPRPRQEFGHPGEPRMDRGPVPPGPEPLLRRIHELEGGLQELRHAMQELRKHLDAMGKERR
ncbi:MAG: hypothetical protein HY674_03990 [Chloroflexi bacterium]|nr:hypothetical protein [Chloroflexota bacterium]